MARDIKIKIASGFDPSGVSAASAALEKMAEDLEKSNKWLMQCNAELSDAIKKHASNVAVDLSAAADKAAKGMGNTYKTLADFLGDVRKESQEASEKLEELRAKIRSASKAAEEAKSRQSVSAAESKLQQAWGWYRDKDSMAAQMQEEKADAEARKLFEKDFASLRDRRRDWRKAENLSVDDEAVRRVALAREEKEAAEKHLAEIEKNTADLAAKLDELLQVKG